MQMKEMIGLLLAGGQGSRLGVLTKNVAKPAVSFGGKYKIIDFSLSNCINSGIDTVGVLTQYKPLELNNHIGIGKPWDMDRMNGGVTALAPYASSEIGEWYKGTANAIFQNIHYVDKHDPEYVVVLSGDHIYKMDYAKMLQFHKEKNADATISVINVPIEEASRFGILNTNEDGSIYEFEEKPKKPKSTLASMGVYVFTWKVLREYLIKDDVLTDSDHDFGKNILPTMLNDGKGMWAYRFDGYWKDVGTIDAYWESNIGLIKLVPDLNLYDPSWRIYTPNPVMPAHYIGSTGVIKKSLVAEGCKIYGEVYNSILFPGVTVEEGAKVVDSIVMSGTCIGKSSQINKCVISENVTVCDNVKAGFGDDTINSYKPNIYYSGITVVGRDAYLPQNAYLGKNVMIDEGVTIEDYSSIEIPSGSSVFKGGKSE